MYVYVYIREREGLERCLCVVDWKVCIGVLVAAVAVSHMDNLWEVKHSKV